MGFKDQFQQNQPRQNKLLDMLGFARGIAGNDPKAALQRMANDGMTCTLPNGKVMQINELMQIAEGKTPQQFLSQLGLN